MINIIEFLENEIVHLKNLKEIDIDRPFMELGLDSKELVLLSGKLEKKLNMELSPTILLEYPSIRKLNEYLHCNTTKNIENMQIVKKANADKISIIGMSCNFPSATSISQFVNLLEESRNCVCAVSNERLALLGVRQDESYKEKVFCGGYINNIDEFDYTYFNFTKEEAICTDPQQRLLLQGVVHALQDAGLTKKRLKNSKVGVFVGASNFDYARKIVKIEQTIDSVVGNSGCMLANRISYLFDFHGPSMTIDTACSSSLVAVYEAVKSLQYYNCDIALVAGVNLILDMNINKALVNANMLSLSGECHTFEERADGYVRGEGIGVIVLQREKDAINKECRIYADILGGGINQDGRSASLTAPNKSMQVEVIEAALKDASISKKDVQYVEAHGTGTELGDYIEISAIDTALECSTRNINNNLYVGAVKTNIGHLESAAGIAGLMKLGLSIYYKKLFPNFDFINESKKIGFEYRNIRVVDEVMDWNQENRIGSVSSFGFGGTNCHMVLANHKNENFAMKSVKKEKKVFIIPISAISKESLLNQLKSLYAYIVKNKNLSLYELENMLIFMSEHMSFKVCYVAETREDLLSQIKETIESELDIEYSRKNKIAFLFSGQGTQWKGMGKSLLQLDLFKEHFLQCRKEFLALGHGDILETLESENLNSTYYVQPLLFSFQISLFEVIKNMGCNCTTVYGHSLGEVAAAYACGAISLNQAALIIHHRSIIMDKFTGQGRMLSVALNESKAEELLNPNSNLSVAVINDENMVVIAGDNEDIEKLKKELDDKKVYNHYLPVNYAFHYKGLEPYVENLKSRLGEIKTFPGKIKFLSSTFAEYKSYKELDAQYWAMNMRKKVRFSEATLQIVRENNLVLEIGASEALLPYLIKGGNSELKVIACQKRNMDSMKCFYETLAQLYKCGCEINWEHIVDDLKCKPSLPLYKFEKTKCWPNWEIQHEIKSQISKQCWDSKRVTDILIKTLKKYVTENIQICESIELNGLGLDSLKYFQLRSDIQRYFNVRIEIKDIISNNKVSDIVSIIVQNMDALNLNEKGSDLRMEDISDLVTDNQKAIIAAQICEPQNSMFNMQGCWQLEDKLKDELWKKAYQIVINRYYIFKMRYMIVNKRIFQTISSEDITLEFVYLSITEDIREYINKEANKAFDVSKKVVNGQLIQDKSGKKYFFLSIHHIAIDGISMYLLVKEMINMYRAMKEDKPYECKKDSRYLEYQKDLVKYKATEKYKKNLFYWKEKLEKGKFAGKFPIVEPYYSQETLYSQEVFFHLTTETIKKLECLSIKFRISKFSILYAVYQLLYYKLTGDMEYVTCTYSSGRFDTKYMDMIGYTVQPVYMRVKIDKDMKIKEFLEYVNNDMIDSFDKYASIYDMNSFINTQESERLNHVFVYEKSPDNIKDNLYVIDEDTDIELCGMQMKALKTEMNYSQYDLIFMFEEYQDSMSAKLQYKEKVYSRDSVNKLMHTYKYLLNEILDNSDNLLRDYNLTNPLNNYLNRMQLLNLDETPLVGVLFHQYLEKYANKSPDKIAARFAMETITYRQLNKKSNQVARLLLQNTKGEKQSVAVCVTKSIDFLAAIFGVMKAGCSYIPLDCKYPIDRLQYILDDSNAKYVIMDKHGESLNLGLNKCELLKLEYSGLDTNLDLKIELEDLAYIIYTSGSTGKPKGVMLAHRGIENVVKEQTRLFLVSQQDIVSFFASVSFDASVFEILMGIGHGACLCFDKIDNMGTGETMRKFLKNYHITVATLPASVLESVDNKDLNKLRVIVTAGEPCSQEIKNKWIMGHEFYNAYGVTEATIWSTTSKCNYGEKVYIGSGVMNHELYILNHERKNCPRGVVGELYIGGIGVSKGYIGLEEVNKERFIKLGEKESICYKTGDLVREDYNGEIEYIGRIDNQVKIRGFRIELEEIEKVLESCAGVYSSIVIVNRDTGKEQLYAFVKMNNEKSKNEEETVFAIKQHLNRFLPYYMIPDRIVAVSEWKLTANGKIDRNAMLKAELLEFDERTIVKGNNRYEIDLCNYLEKILDKKVSIYDKMLFIGVNSIVAYDILCYIRDNYKVNLDFAFIMRNPTISEIADKIAKCNMESLNEKLAIHNVIKYKISKKQKGIWLSCHINKNSTEFNIPIVLKVEGNFDLELCKEAFNMIFQRHNILRTSYEYNTQDGEIWADVTNNETPFFEFEDLSQLSTDNRKEVLNQRIQEMQNIIFNVEKVPLYKILVLKKSENIFYVMLTIHHLIADGWSVNVLLDEFRNNYEQLKKGYKEKEILDYQYEDYVRDVVSKENYLETAEDERYWIEKLQNSECRLQLSDCKTRPEIMMHEGNNIEINLDKNFLQVLNNFANCNEVTVFSLMLAAYAIVLKNYSGEQEIIIGVPDLGRRTTKEKKLIGMFLDTIIVKISFDENKKIKDYLKEVLNELIESHSHSKLGLDKIVELINPQRDIGSTPIVQVLFNMINFSVSMSDIDNMPITVIENSNLYAKYDITVYVTEYKNHMNIRLNYYSKVYEENYMMDLLESFKNILYYMTQNPDLTIRNCSSLNPDYTKLITPLSFLNNNDLMFGFYNNLTVNPEKCAIRHKNEDWSYRKLYALTEEISKQLKEYKITEGECIGVISFRIPRIIPAIMSIVSCKASFVIIEKSLPEEFRKTIIEENQANLIMFVNKTNVTIKRIKVTEDKNIPGYRIMTSGTTGKPKCIIGNNAAVNHFVMWEAERFEMKMNERFTILSGIMHDPILRDIFVPFYLGAMIVFPDNETVIENNLYQYFKENKVTVTHMTPSIAEVLLIHANSDDNRLMDIKYIFLGGEILKKSTVLSLQTLCPNARIVNYYGASETPQAMAYKEYLQDEMDNFPEKLPLGKGIDNVEILILNEDKKIMDNRNVGEIAIRTPYLSGGYFNNITLNKDKFIENLYHMNENDLIYMTGDYGVENADGDICIIGRRDAEVKVLGQRVNLQEVECIIQESGSVLGCKVILYQDNLYGFVIPKENYKKDFLRMFLQNKCSAYMIPANILELQQFPVTQNGKIDYKSLCSYIGKMDNEEVNEFSKVETMIKAIWCSILNIEKITLKDKFFEVGGNSIKAVMLQNQLTKVFHKEIDIVDIFKYPTIQSFANFIENKNRKTNTQSEKTNMRGNMMRSAYKKIGIQRR